MNLSKMNTNFLKDLLEDSKVNGSDDLSDAIVVELISRATLS